ncbi:MAG TPA: hybrid sensor histidine kinase/response regulator [Casimicrobiaceae bacterium]|nr:hybrid sensor histidine kinase/response regulator [Casimicrobiaceae bacterium]
MSSLATLDPAVRLRARADQVATLYSHGHLTTVSMGLGAAIFCGVMWDEAAHGLLAGWAALVAINQAWRTVLLRAWQRTRPGAAAAPRWGSYWAAGSTIAGALWGTAAVVLFPAPPAYQALLIVCLFGVIMGGLNLTAVYKPSFYGFVLPALVPLIVRVAVVGDPVHLFTAMVLGVVLGFVVGFGHRLNDVLTHSLTIRYENLDLIGELKDRTRAAQDARAAAEKANRGKSQLLAAASHDLRQPLHALGLYAAALAARAHDDQCRPLVENVQEGIVALEHQFGQLLDLSRLEAGALHADCSDIELGPLLARVANEYGAQAATRGLALRVVCTSLVVRSDPVLLERIVGNLVANAVRYTRRGGVVLGARRRGHDVAIVVADSGIGIAPFDMSRIFEEFYQVADERAPSARKGMGLGLAIVRRFADLLEHRIEVTSEPGRGSRFRVVLPQGARRRVAARSAQTAGRTRFEGLSGRLIAVLDDDPAAIDAMRALFSTSRAEVAGATRVGELLDALGRCARYPDLVVADLRLGGALTGIDAIAQLRFEFGIAIPAMIVSGDTSLAAAALACEARLPLLAKPVDAVTLQEQACRLLSGARETHGAAA